MSCPCEKEVLASVATLHCGVETRSHLDSCNGCRELYEIASALREARGESMAEARLPAAGGMWWRMRMRRKREIGQRAARVMITVQGAALAVALAIAIPMIGPLPLPTWSTPLLITLGAALVCTPVALWLARE